MTRNEEHAPSVSPNVRQIVKKAAARGAEASFTESQPMMKAMDALSPLPRAKTVISTVKSEVIVFSSSFLVSYLCKPNLDQSKPVYDAADNWSLRSG